MGCCRLPCGEMRSISGGMSIQLLSLRLPCVKGAVFAYAKTEGLFSFTTSSSALLTPPLTQGGLGLADSLVANLFSSTPPAGVPRAGAFLCSSAGRFLPARTTAGPDQAIRAPTNEVLPAAPVKCLQYQSPVFWPPVLKQCPLHLLFLIICGSIYLFPRQWINSRIIHYCRSRSRRWIKILHLFGRQPNMLHIQCKLHCI